MACSGGGSTGSTAGTDPTPVSCSGSCATATSVLTTGDVEQVIAQGVFEAQARRVSATIAVVDRVGNVLAVYRFGGTSSARSTRGDPDQMPSAGRTYVGGLEGILLPIDAAAAIAKAVTGAYLSSEGNAFSSRVASQIVQANFNPGEKDQPRGRCSACSFHSSLARTSSPHSTALHRTPARSGRRSACRRTQADFPCTRMALSWAGWACLLTVCTRWTPTSPTSTAASTKPSHTQPRSGSPRRSIVAATGSPLMARPCASATSTSVAWRQRTAGFPGSSSLTSRTARWSR